MLSVNTNTGAMLALQQLNATNRDLSEVQTRINTGLKIAGPKDDGAVFAIAQNMRGEIAGFEAVKTALDNAVSVIDVGLAAGQSVSDLLIEMKEKAVAALDQSLETSSRNALQNDFAALRDQIATIVGNAEFNGFNALDGSVSSMSVLANPDGDTITVTAQNMTTGTAGLTLSALSLSTATNAAAARSGIDAAIDAANQQLAVLGTRAKTLDIHTNFVDKLIDSLNTGVGNLVDADLAKESARLQALQIKQQLGTQALSIANQAPQSILSLFG
ncbi:flagellin [Minwuia thermotolerans]|jgi:flagellin|uniref:Flagellin n=1 Tax=Minwuia thermotolerans TaxID=2056226 RepID=A0A2M9FYU6_9PROT|nr:flagellin [Minwuia thermotolerans]ANK83023.1 MAG: flagellin [Rhizobiales bacterium NRL2]PJK28609.1 flagellin [Minwuia thermotolerans]